MCTKTINPNNHSAIFEPEYLLSIGCGKNRPTIFSFRTGASAIVSVISYLLTAIIRSLNVNNEQLGKMGRPPCRDDDRAQRLGKDPDTRACLCALLALRPSTNRVAKSSTRRCFQLSPLPSETREAIARLRDDHDFFMQELAAAVKIVRTLISMSHSESQSQQMDEVRR